MQELCELVKYIETNEADVEGGLAMKLKDATDKAYEDEVWVGSLISVEEAIENRAYFAAKEARAEGLAEGAAEEQERMSRLMAKMQAVGVSPDGIVNALASKDKNALYEQYGV